MSRGLIVQKMCIAFFGKNRSLGYNENSQNMVQLLFLAILSVLLYFNLAAWHSPILGWALAVGLLFFATNKARVLLSKFFGFSSAFRTYLLAGFSVLNIVGFFAGMVLFFTGVLKDVFIAVIFFIVAVVLYLIQKFTTHFKNAVNTKNQNDWQILEEFPQHKILVLVYLGLVALGFYLLFVSVSDKNITTPWQVIDYHFLWVYTSALIMLGILLFSSSKAKVILFLLFVQALLTFSYLPLTHTYFYGADQWRHSAVESRLLSGLSLNTAVLSVQPKTILQFFDLGKLAYAQFWSLGTISAKILNIDILFLNKWLAPVLYALVFPILLFEVGRALDFGKRKALLFAYCAFLPFALQIAGAFTLPNNLSFLYFLFLFLLLLKWNKYGGTSQTVGLAILGAFSVFGYLLYFILFWLIWLLLFLYQKKRLWFWLCAFVAGAFLPAMELMAGYSRWTLWAPLNSLKKLLIGLFSWRIAFGLPNSDTDFGNILFNQPAVSVLIKNIFTVWPYWIFIFALLFWVLAIYGLYKIFKVQEKIWLAVIILVLFVNHFVSRLFLGGDNILTRRMDFVLALSALILFFYALSDFIPEHWQFNFKKDSLLIILFILIISIGAATSYASGPDAFTVDRNEYLAMAQINNVIKNTPACVLSDTYALLILEYLSQKQIIGGGFPINENFAQPEREKIYQILLNADDENVQRSAKMFTGAETCYLVAKKSELKYNIPVEKTWFHSEDIVVLKF